ncbi:MAG: hypothetical protein QM708_14105 [Propioniciclava sp.]|uniref:hypothetical protein n=1 Tax=Propioniciclava sp. TaxID=2038686 RepID=UPI0039E34EEE
MPNLVTSTVLDKGAAASGFRIKRTLATVQGQQAATDQTVGAVLDELDALLRKAVIGADEPTDAVTALARLTLTPARAKQVGVGRWAKESLAAKLKSLVENDGELTISEVIAANQDLSDLRYAFDADLQQQSSVLDFNTRVVLDRTGIRDLVFARGTLLFGIRQRASLLTFATSHRLGAGDMVGYAKVSAARELVAAQSLRVRLIEDDDSHLVAALRASEALFTAAGFPDAMLSLVKTDLAESKFDDIIVASKVSVPAELRPRLIALLNAAPVTVTEENAAYMVPLYLAKAASAEPLAAPSTDPFGVTFYGDDAASSSVNSAAVKCAAQLYYVMTLGDELGLFEAMRYFTDSYLYHDGLAVEDPVLRKDLEDYVFSGRFPVIDYRTGQIDKVNATREPLRRAYYRQVFNSGSAPTAGDAPVNDEFLRLWKILILESARYLERAQVSPNPDNFVSRQNVMQAVEDLQYNLSSNCVGLATVMTPLMNAELDFLVTRIFQHPEIRSHVVPGGGSWLKVVEKLAVARGARARVSVLNNKARLGYTLINQIADYTAWSFEQDGPFSEFISNVDAFITTQSILQEQLADDDERRETSGDAPTTMPGMPDPASLPGMPPGLIPQGLIPSSSGARTAPGDEWDF